VTWSKAVADEWGYDVTIDGLGRSVTKDPWGRDGDGDTLRASQAVTFRRREDEGWATRRAERYAEWASRSEGETQAHTLLVTHHYEAHVGAQSLAPREDIASAVKSTIQGIGSSDVTIFEVWREDAVSTICGGWLEVLLEVLEKDDAFLLHKEGKNADDWRIELPGVELEGKNFWQSPPRDDAWGDSSESTESAETYDEAEEEYYEGYDGDDWEETEDSGWAVSEDGCSKDESDINTLKAWGEWRPANGWIMDSEGSWN